LLFAIPVPDFPHLLAVLVDAHLVEVHCDYHGVISPGWSCDIAALLDAMPSNRPFQDFANDCAPSRWSLAASDASSTPARG
jgi:hypothetical protein